MNAFANLKQPISDAFTSVKGSVQGFWNDTLLPFGEYLTADYIPTMVNAFSETFAPIFSDVMSFAVTQFASDFEFSMTQISNFVNDIFKPAMDTVKNITVDILGAVKDEWDKSGENLLNLFGGVRDSIKEIWNNLYEKILKPVWDSLISAIDGLWNDHLKGLWESIVSFTSKLGEAVMTVWNNFLAPIVNWLIDVAGPLVVGVIQSVIAWVKDFAGMLADVVRGVLKSLGGLLDFITGVFSGDWKKAWNGIKDFFKGIWDGIWGIVKGIVNLIIDGINMLWTGIYNAVKGIINGIGGIAGAIGDIFGKDWKFSMPSKPP